MADLCCYILYSNYFIVIINVGISILQTDLKGIKVLLLMTNDHWYKLRVLMSQEICSRYLGVTLQESVRDNKRRKNP